MVRGLDGDPRLASFVFTGFGDRLLSEVKKLAPKDVKIKVRLWRVPVGHWVPSNHDTGEGTRHLQRHFHFQPSCCSHSPVPSAPS